MVKQLTIISASRLYRFRRDDIRLTVLSNREMLNRIRDVFDFEEADLDSPHGEGRTFPPGLLLHMGRMASEAGPSTPIRHLSIDARQIMISVAGYTEAIDSIYARLRSLLADLIAPDGQPALTEPVIVQDHSEIVARLSFDPMAVLAPEVRRIASDVFARYGAVGSILVPQLQLGLTPSEEELRRWSAGDRTTFQLGLRTGVPASDQHYHSSAPLDTKSHIELLEKLETDLAKGARSKSNRKRDNHAPTA